MRTTFLVFNIFILFESCIENFNPKINNYIELPVVEGFITNEPGPYIIKLSKSMDVYSLNYVPITGARVTINDDINNEETLIELEPGCYYTDYLGIIGEVGRKYRLTLDIDGKIYQSNYEELNEPIEIDSVFAKIEYHETRYGSVGGLQFYLNTHSYREKNAHYLWNLIETYKYQSDLVLEAIYFRPDSFIMADNDTMRVCWKTENVLDILTFSTKNTGDIEINNIPLHYVNSETNKLFIKYSLLVKQYSVTEKAEAYWKEIREQNSGSSSMYSKQPFQIRGNIFSLNSPEDIVLGYFGAGGVSEKRIFVEPPLIDFNFYLCQANTYSFKQMKSGSPVKFPVYVTWVGEDPAIASYYCFDCRSRGGKTKKPEFWED